MLCEYGCGQEATSTLKNGKRCCKPSSNSCPVNRSKNSSSIKQKIEQGLIQYTGRYSALPKETKDRMAWARGLTKDDPRVAKTANTITGRRKITDQEKLKRTIYREQAQFNLAGIIQFVEGFELLEKYGMYHRKSNTLGVVRDHIVSVDYGYKHQIDPKIISHPANCRFVPHKDNARKSNRNGYSVEELMERIRLWEEKIGTQP